MVGSAIASGTSLQLLSTRTDSPRIEPYGDSASRRRDFAPEKLSGGQSERPSGAPGIAARQGGAIARALPFLRRRTDRGEPADSSIQIPPHLERRRAWREAFGLNTYHTQQLAQAEESRLARDARATAIQAYRSLARRGHLDLELAQAVSVTV